MTLSGAEHIALVGLSGSGKSTAAPLLASRTGRVAVDLDRVVAARVGRTVEQIFADADGESSFRTMETEALLEALDGPPAVIATGGGVVLSAENRSSLRRGAAVVWLRAHPSQLAARLVDTAEARPLLDGDAEFALQRLSAERSALYDEVADLVVDVDGVAPVTVVEDIVERLGGGRP